MKTTIRDFGDGQTVVVHTNDRELASQLANYKYCFKVVPYEQWFRGKPPVLVGVDYYFPKNWIPHITLAMSDLTPKIFKNAWNEFKDLKFEFNQKLHNICIAKKLPDGKIRIAKKYDL